MQGQTVNPIYLDNQATTKVDFRVLDAMLPYLSDQYGNPHSTSHKFGWDANEIVEKSRAQIASLIKAENDEIIFQSGATESNNSAILGITKHYGSQEKNHIISTKMEHKTVLETLEFLKKTQNFTIDYVDIGENGIVNLNHLKSLISKKTLLVSIMTLNNEIGVIQDIQAIGDIINEFKIIDEKQNDIFFHTDSAQALGKLKIDVHKMHIDLLSITAHKMYGPKGIGALFISKKPRKIIIEPMINGGGQERGLRSGTLAPYLCVGLGQACQLAQDEFENDKQHIEKLSNFMRNYIINNIGEENIHINGDEKQRYKGNLNISFKNLVGADIQKDLLDKIALSAGAACIKGGQPSYVLQAIKIKPEFQSGVLRLGFGRFTTMEEVEYAAKQLVQVVNNLYKQQKQ